MNIPNTPAADRYASLKIQRDMIDSELEFLKTQIVETGKDLVEGIDYNVKVTLSQRSTIDYDQLQEKYGVTEAQMKLYNACKKEGAPFPVLKVVAKSKEA